MNIFRYLGSYVADERGRLVFREGALVKAVRQGDWVILDELNLAPTDVIEALNRVLFDEFYDFLNCDALVFLKCYFY